MAANQTRRRRIGGWGFDGQSYPPSPQLTRWLEGRTGEPGHPVPPGPAAPPEVDLQPLPPMPIQVSADPMDRLAHSRGQGLADVLRLRCGLVPALPDGVGRPVDEDQLTAVLEICARSGIRVIPWGGGTSVTGGVNVIAGEPPVLTLDLERMEGLVDLDEVSGLATFGPGTTGPAAETALAAHGLTLGHFPQSWELSTVGGWVATRSSGQESLGYGRIEDMVAGLSLVSPEGRLRLDPRPASAAGPDLRQLVLGSEGRLGVITGATLRTRPRPPVTEVEGALIPDLDSGLDAVRELVTAGVPLTMVRLSDAVETQVAMAVGLGKSSAAPLVRRYLSLRGLGDDSCIMLYGAAGTRGGVREILACARRVVRRHRGVILGRGPGRHWLRDRYRHPYLRESLLDLGWATDTMETAASWSAVPAVRRAVASRISRSLEPIGEAVPVLCHVSHPYRDGASLYFTFFFRCAADPEQTIDRWATIKRAANDALVEQKVTVSHHHGVGQWHAPWLKPEIGELGLGILTSAAHRLDPSGILNRHVLLDGTDRLEE
jgi:alkyldihydroxyacetonephosphate synthase